MKDFYIGVPFKNHPIGNELWFKNEKKNAIWGWDGIENSPLENMYLLIQ